MTQTVFGQILAGNLPCHRVYEDDLVLAFLDTGPISRGHLLVIPKEPAETLDLLSDRSAAALGRVLPQLHRGLRQSLGVTALNVLQNNGTIAHQAVRHVHFHLVPKRSAEDGLLIRWNAHPLDPDDGALLAAEIVAALQSRDREDVVSPDRAPL